MQPGRTGRKYDRDHTGHPRAPPSDINNINYVVIEHIINHHMSKFNKLRYIFEAGTDVSCAVLI